MFKNIVLLNKPVSKEVQTAKRNAVIKFNERTIGQYTGKHRSPYAGISKKEDWIAFVLNSLVKKVSYE